MRRSSTPPVEAHEATQTEYPWSSPYGAGRAYIRLRDSMSSCQSLDGARTTSTAILDSAGNVTAWETVPTPLVDGGSGFNREDRLAALGDLERCLPTTLRDRLALLISCAVSRRRAVKVLSDYTGYKWNERMLAKHKANGLRAFADNLRERGLLPPREVL